ncbi:unnamed protein product [Pleuronectes platessa]|uniref:Uncharacterized protein n=1 Tax=Pleuronectes platessa TaxID=8262 RepID=A0A9N7YS82_PLEPL|nr:unnamed protein product [Pleuronectes platessa]
MWRLLFRTKTRTHENESRITWIEKDYASIRHQRQENLHHPPADGVFFHHVDTERGHLILAFHASSSFQPLTLMNCG